MGVFPFAESFLNGRSVKDIVLVVIRTVDQVSCIIKQFLDRFFGEFNSLDSGVSVGIQASRNEGVHDVCPFVFGMLKNVPIIDLAGMKEFVVSRHRAEICLLTCIILTLFSSANRNMHNLNKTTTCALFAYMLLLNCNLLFFAHCFLFSAQSGIRKFCTYHL